MHNVEAFFFIASNKQNITLLIYQNEIRTVRKKKKNINNIVSYLKWIILICTR